MVARFKSRHFWMRLLYVVRYNYTQGELLAFVEEQHAKGVVGNVGIILNDVGQQKGYGYGYGYGYVWIRLRLRLRLWIWIFSG